MKKKKKLKTRNKVARELHFRSGCGVHEKSFKAKRRAAKVALRNE